MKDGGKVLIGISIAIFLFYKIGSTKIITALLSMDIRFIPLILILTGVLALMNASSLVVLYHPLKKKEVSLWQFFRLRLLTLILGNITPNKVGELYLFFLLKKMYKIKILPIFSIFVMDKATTLVHALFFTGIWYAILVKGLQTSIIFGVGILILLMGLVGLVYGIRKIEKISWNLLYIRNIKSLLKYERKFLSGYILENYKYLVANIGITFLSVGITTLLGEIVFLSLQIKVPFFTYFLILNAVFVASLIPLNIVGIGIKEVSTVYLLKEVIGIPTSVGASGIIIILASRYVVYLVLYLFLIRAKES